MASGKTPNRFHSSIMPTLKSHTSGTILKSTSTTGLFHTSLPKTKAMRYSHRDTCMQNSDCGRWNFKHLLHPEDCRKYLVLVPTARYSTTIVACAGWEWCMEQSSRWEKWKKSVTRKISSMRILKA